VLGKYLGTFSFFIIMAIMISLMPLSLLAGSELDLLLLTSAVIGLVLLLASFTAIGLFLSSLTKQPAIAAISTFTSLFMLWILDWASNTQVAEPDSLFSWLSLLSHFQPMLQGELNSKDISYYLIVIASFILLTVKQLDAERINK
jgi:ABC-2 type transport system permease protein